MLGKRKRTYTSKARTGVNMSIHKRKPDYEKLNKERKVNNQKKKDAKLCIGCEHNDGGFCRYSQRWCHNARTDKACEKLK